MKVGKEPGAMIVRVSQNAKGIDLPPDLATNAPKRKSNGNSAKLITFVDLDHFIEGGFSPDVEWIEENMFLLHDNIVETLHNNVITEGAIQKWT